MKTLDLTLSLNTAIQGNLQFIYIYIYIYRERERERERERRQWHPT